MTTQLFKSNIPNNILFDFLDSIYLFKNENFYTISNASFK